jgi:CubicO group peptidase (beta-lactamase class C family)
MEYATGSGLAYWAGASSIEGMRNRGLIREPGTFWDYENYDTLLAVYALKKTFKSPEEYLTYPHRALFDQLGMTNYIAVDRSFWRFHFLLSGLHQCT